MSADDHGRASTYTNHDCRCDECREAWRVATADRRVRRKAAPMPDFVRHGKASTYQNWACRCASCTAAQAGRRRYRPSNTSATK